MQRAHRQVWYGNKSVIGREQGAPQRFGQSDVAGVGKRDVAAELPGARREGRHARSSEPEGRQPHSTGRNLRHSKYRVQIPSAKHR